LIAVGIMAARKNGMGWDGITTVEISQQTVILCALSAPRSSSSAKAGDPYGGEIMAGGNRALDLRPPFFKCGDDNGEVARMSAMHPHHNVILPFMGRISNPNRCTGGTDGKEILLTRSRMTTEWWE
jgi:hypothetical protein